MFRENDYRDYIQHHGIQGQKWGVRRYQNSDGTLTQLGKNRKSAARDATKQLNSLDKKNAFNKRYLSERNSEVASYNKKDKKLKEKYASENNEYKRQKIKNAMAVNNERMASAKKASKLLMKDISKNNKEIGDLKKYLEKSGYNVSAKQTIRNVSTKSEMVFSVGAAMLQVAAGSPIIFTTSRTIRGTKYKVKDRSGD